MVFKFATFLLLQSLTQLVTASLPIRELRKKVSTAQDLTRRDVDPSTLYPAYNISVPIDHFHNESEYEPHTNDSFNLRYWFDASYYKPGGPVIVLQSGEDTGTDRLPYLQKGILAQLANATNGIGVVLEHRYYGTSFPTPDLSTENLRFLTTEQALADEAYFAQNIVFPGLENLTLTAPDVAYIGYGGSYAGAFNAFLRVLYPDVFWGTIGSSGVVEAIWDYWNYFEPIREYGPPSCIVNQQKLTNIVDNIIIGSKNNQTINELKAAFGLQNLTYNDDFASVLSYGIDNWQSLNWDPEVTSNEFYNYCFNLTANTTLYPATANLTSTVKKLIAAGGYANQTQALLTPMLNYIGYVNLTEVSAWAVSGETQDEYFSARDPTFYEQDDITQTWRSWPYQYCTQWGFLQTGSGVPANQLPLLSRTQNLEYESIICVDAFNITTPPNTDAINKYGGYNISYPRLAFIDGEEDPWRPACVHANPFNTTAQNRTSTTDQPFILIQGAVHHWDENGLFPNETTASLPPAPVADTQRAEVQFVQAWMKEFAAK